MVIAMALMKTIDGEKRYIDIENSVIYTDTIVIQDDGEELRMSGLECLEYIQEKLEEGWELVR
jgi:hypothetical protein